MRLLAQASDAQLRIGESILPVVVMDSGLASSTRPGMTAEIMSAALAYFPKCFAKNAMLRGQAISALALS